MPEIGMQGTVTQARVNNKRDYLTPDTWGRLNINVSSYLYRDPHVKDKTVSRPSYL